MNAILTIILNGDPVATYRWPAVPAMGDIINLDVNGMAGARHVVVRGRLWVRRNDGECGVDLRCEPCQ